MRIAVGEKNVCLKCGKCCKLIQSSKSFEELELLAQEGNNSAENFLKLFLPYSSTEEVLKIDENAVKRMVEFNKQKFGSDFETYFYHCRYLNEDNSCKVYKGRPRLCKEYPKNVFTILPEGCAYEGYLFEAREETMKYIRKIKEELLQIACLKENCKNPDKLKKYDNFEKKYTMIVDKYRIYGSQEW